MRVIRINCLPLWLRLSPFPGWALVLPPSPSVLNLGPDVLRSENEEGDIVGGDCKGGRERRGTENVQVSTWVCGNPDGLSYPDRQWHLSGPSEWWDQDGEDRHTGTYTVKWTQSQEIRYFMPQSRSTVVEYLTIYKTIYKSFGRHRTLVGVTLTITDMVYLTVRDV